MTRNNSVNETLVLSIFLSSKGFGFVVFEGPDVLVDWGVKSASGPKKNRDSLKKIQELLDFYYPDSIAMDWCGRATARRSKRIIALTDRVAGEARRKGIAAAFFSRNNVRDAFSNSKARTKREIALTIVRRFPELESRLPPVRRIWMSEDARMNIFDAAALGLTFFHTKRRAKRAA